MFEVMTVVSSSSLQRADKHTLVGYDECCLT
jgi:hypothetical protein